MTLDKYKNKYICQFLFYPLPTICPPLHPETWKIFAGVYHHNLTARRRQDQSFSFSCFISIDPERFGTPTKTMERTVPSDSPSFHSIPFHSIPPLPPLPPLLLLLLCVCVCCWCVCVCVCVVVCCCCVLCVCVLCVCCVCVVLMVCVCCVCVCVCVCVCGLVGGNHNEKNKSLPDW